MSKTVLVVASRYPPIISILFLDDEVAEALYRVIKEHAQRQLYLTFRDVQKPFIEPSLVRHARELFSSPDDVS